MKKMALLTNALAALMMILVVAGALCGAVKSLATDVDFYCGMSRAAVMDTLGVTDDLDVSSQTTAYIGMTDEEQHVFAEEIVLFMKGETDVQPDVLNEKEQQHMRDVRDLILLSQKVSQSCMTLAAALAVVIAWTGAKDKRSGMPLGVLAGLGITLLIALIVYALMNTQGFEQMFIWMHEILFTNDLWLLDPREDILIRMMPQLLFERAAEKVVTQAVCSFLITWAMLLIVHTLVSGIIKRHLSKEE